MYKITEIHYQNNQELSRELDKIYGFGFDIIQVIQTINVGAEIDKHVSFVLLKKRFEGKDKIHDALLLVKSWIECGNHVSDEIQDAIYGIFDGQVKEQ